MVKTRRRRLRSITLPIVFASVAVALSIALLVGWTLLIARNFDFSEDVGPDISLLVLGILSFAFIMGTLILFSIFLAREIREGRRQDTFIDSVTHELKSPLASLRLCLETLERDDLDSNHQGLLHNMMGEDLDRLSSFIDDVLQASRLSYEKAAVHVTKFSLRELVDHCADLASVLHRVPREAIRVYVDPSFSVSTDAAALQMVMKNLLDNAIKYSDDPASIEVRAGVEEGHPVIEVRDQGIGIPRQHLKRVFHRFFRVPEIEAKGRRGTGIGLFVVSSLVRDLGGRVQARSDGAGKGTSMRVVLPRESIVAASPSS